MDAETRFQLSAILENRRRKGRAITGVKFALAIEQERFVKARQPSLVALSQNIVHGLKADDATVPAALGPAQAQQTDIIGRNVVIRVVDVEANLDVGLVRANTRSGER